MPDEEKPAGYSLEIVVKGGKWTRYRHKDYDTALAEARRIAAVVRAKKEMFFEIYPGHFLRLSEVVFIGTSPGTYPGWND